MSVQRQAVPRAETSAVAADPPRAEMRDVSFGYREDQPIFSGFSWQITPAMLGR